MSFLPSLAAWQWALLAAVPAGIVLLYFLKLRRQPVTVPSTFLWQKTVEDLHVNSLLQRLRTNPLLWLQLLAVALAAFALFRPGYRDLSRSDSRRIFLLDSSASMQATDVSGASNRFELARQLIASEIDAMSDQDVAMLMTVSDRVDVLQSFTSDRRRLRDALASAEVTNRPIDMGAAIRAAEGLASVRKAEASDDEAAIISAGNEISSQMVLYSDGGFEDLSGIDLADLKLTYTKIGTDAVSNLAIVAFSAQRNEAKAGELEAFATIANLGTKEASSAVSLKMNGELVDADEVSLAPGEEAGLTFKLTDEDLVRLSVTLDASDDLRIDNVAFATLAPTKTASVLLVTPGNKPLELALRTGQAEKLCVLEVVEPNYLATDVFKARAATGIDQLMIFDRCQPQEMPRTNTFMIGALPPKAWGAGEKSSNILLVDIDRTHPVMRYLDLFSLLIAEGRTLKPPAGGSELLIAEGGPVLAIAPREGFEDLVLGFEVISTTTDGATAFNTDWQVQRSWPVFVFNVVRYLTGSADLRGRVSHVPGSTVALLTDQRQGELSVRGPGGQVEFVKPDPTGRVTYLVGDQVGVYQVEDEKRMIDLFSVNLFDRRESSIASADGVQFGAVEVSGEQAQSESRREFWRLLLLAMLGVLSLEWWYYGRRLA